MAQTKPLQVPSPRRLAPTRRHPRGFTLAELMVVVVIIAVLSAVGLATVGNNRAERDTRNAVARVSDTLLEIRSRSMLTGRAIVVQVDNGDPVAGRIAQISWFESPDNLCANASAILTGRAVLDHRDSSSAFGQVTIDIAVPLASGFTSSARFCVVPSGRVVDPLTSRPVERVGASVYDGRVYLRVSEVRCIRGGNNCSLGPLRVLMAIDYTGLVEQLAPGAVLP